VDDRPVEPRVAGADESVAPPRPTDADGDGTPVGPTDAGEAAAAPGSSDAGEAVAAPVPSDADGDGTPVGPSVAGEAAAAPGSSDAGEAVAGPVPSDADGDGTPVGPTDADGGGAPLGPSVAGEAVAPLGPSDVDGDGARAAVAEAPAPIEGVEAGAAEPASAPAEPGGRGRWWARLERWAPVARVVLFALVGAGVAVIIAGRVPAQVGPFDTTVGTRPSLHGRTVVHLAPLGTIELDTHDWPLDLDLRVEELGLDDAERIAGNPAVIEQLGDDVADDVRAALGRLAVRCVLLALAGGVVGALAARLRWRSALAGVAAAAAFVVVAGAGTVVTFDANAVAEPRYTGLLTRAPTVVGDVRSIIDRFGEYRAQLSDLVGNVVTLYLAAESLPTFEPTDDTIRVLHVSDIHLNPQAFDLIEQLKGQFGIDVIADTGDIVDWGTEPESQLLAQIGDLEVPYVYVRGNHDSRSTQRAVGAQPNAVVLDGDAAEVAGLRFWGIGDPRYTPEMDQASGPSDRERAESFASEVAAELGDAGPPPIDVVMVHDARIAADLGGRVPLVLAGHTHEPSEGRIEPQDDDDADDDDADDDGTSATGGDQPRRDETTATAGDGAGDEPQVTRLLVEGSTGGAGLRGLQGDEPKPLQASVLYFDPETGALLAYDRISVKGLGETGATIERHIIAVPEDDDETASG
jgi:predicted phosphodiesterase